MSSTFSNLKFELITTGEQSGTWGTTTDTNVGTAIEQAIAGMATLTSANFTANVATLTAANTNTAQNFRALCLVISSSRIVRDGRAENEGDVQVPPMSPYPIAYRAIVPKTGECENLLVPVCLSASHIAYGSIRMEPVFMILGQSAATAAVQAIEEGVAVQRIDYAKLRARLLADGQVLEWTKPAPPSKR